jgi:AraC-like DNA-binding protein
MWRNGSNAHNLSETNMGFFDDISFIDGDVIPRCSIAIDQRFAGVWSLELKLGGSIRLARDGGRQTIHHGPVVFWHQPEHRYRYGPARPEGWWEHHWLTFRGERGRRLVELGCAELAACGWLAVAQARPLATLFRELIGLVRARDPRRHPEAVLLLERLLAVLQEEARGAAGSGSSAAVTAVAESVRSEPFRTWDWQREARACDLSAGHFRRCFRRATGLSPHAWLLRMRMQEAARRLGAGDEPVAAVAAACGYDPQRFSRLFHQVIGLPPRLYRAHLPRAFG